MLHPVLALMRRYRPVVLGEREFHSVAFATWLRQMQVNFVLRMPKSTTVQQFPNSQLEHLNELPQDPGIAHYQMQVQVTQHSDFWLGLDGRLWIDSMDCWANWAQQLMRLNPQKQIFFLRGLKAMRAIQSTF